MQLKYLTLNIWSKFAEKLSVPCAFFECNSLISLCSKETCLFRLPTSVSFFSFFNKGFLCLEMMENWVHCVVRWLVSDRDE